MFTSPQYKYSCRHCLKAFSRKDHLTIHENLHADSQESYPCLECGAAFKNKKTLAGHAKTHSAQRRGFRCPQCDSEFTRRASLNRHVRAAHAGQTIACDLCPATFSYRSTMEDHKKAVHNDGRREFACALCGVQFAVKAYLTKHMVSLLPTLSLSLVFLADERAPFREKEAKKISIFRPTDAPLFQ